jgi:hypothetical protein
MRLPVALPIVLFSAAASIAAASDRTVTIAARATISERTSLSVSSNSLQFVVVPGNTTATATLDFTAAVRTAPGREVVVIAEPVVPRYEGLRFEGEGEGVLSGQLSADAPAVVARYTGGGLRQGKIAFTLEAAAPGVYTVPVRLLVTVL